MKKTIAVLSLLVAVPVLIAARPPAPEPAPAAEASPASLRIHGAGVQETTLSLADLGTLPRKTLLVKDRDDAESKYEGVTVQDVLTKAGMKFGQSMRGARLRDYLLVEAGDNYAVVFALPELSDEFSDSTVIVADRVNGAPITGRDGPLRIIATQDKKHARWVRNVTSLSVQSSAIPQPK